MIIRSCSICCFLCSAEPSGRLPPCSLGKKTNTKITAELEYNKEIKPGMARKEYTVMVLFIAKNKG